MSDNGTLSPFTSALLVQERRWVIPTPVQTYEVGPAFVNCRESPSTKNTRNHFVSAMFPWMNPKDRVLFFGLNN